MRIPIAPRDGHVRAAYRARCSGAGPMTVVRTCYYTTVPPPNPAHRAKESDRIGAQRIGRRALGRGLGVQHHHCEGVEDARKPRGQTVGQQAEGGVALGRLSASDACSGQRRAHVGAVTCQRTSTVRMIRTPLKAYMVPHPGTAAAARTHNMQSHSMASIPASATRMKFKRDSAATCDVSQPLATGCVRRWIRSVLATPSVSRPTGTANESLSPRSGPEPRRQGVRPRKPRPVLGSARGSSE